MQVNGERVSNNVTVLQCKFNKNNSVTVLNNVTRADKFKCRQRKTEYIADKLVEKFNAPEWRRFFLKVAWRLPEDAIWSTLEMAFSNKVKSSKRLHYYIAACNRQMGA
jgi:hypothetical protein